MQSYEGLVKSPTKIDMNDRKKRHYIFHVNMLRKWHTQAVAYLSEDIQEKWQEEDVSLCRWQWSCTPRAV